MAILHQATLSPSKAELLADHLPTVEGLGISADEELSLIGAYRFDDPAGDVGIETHLLSIPDGRVIQIPVTYRAAPLDGAEDWLIATLEHSALGTRWVYDACGDPVYIAELVRTIVEGDTQVKLEILTPDGTIERENIVHVTGSGGAGATSTIGAIDPARSGTTTVISTDAGTITVRHVLEAATPPADPHLSGTWPEVDDARIMATLDQSS